MTGHIADHFAQRKIVATDEFLEGTPQRERLRELGLHLRPGLGAPVLVQHRAQDTVDAKPRVPEALVGVALSVHLVFGHGVGAPLSTANRTRAEREGDGTVQVA